MGLDGRQRQIGRAIARRRFEAAAELDEAEGFMGGDKWEDGTIVKFSKQPRQRIGGWTHAEELQPQDELAPRGGFIDWPVLVMFALVLVTAAGTAYVAVNG